MEGVRTIGTFEDPVRGHEVRIEVVPADLLEVATFQRKPSKQHVKALAESIGKLGFLVPLITVKDDGSGRYIIIDGQHRYLAARDHGAREFPCVVVPKELMKLMLNLNTEKQLNIKEKSTVAYNVYQDLVEKFPEKEETDIEIMDAVLFPYYVTFGVAYEEKERFAGTAYEPAMKKVDFFLAMPLKDALEERRKRGKALVELDVIVDEIVQKIKEMQGQLSPFIKKEIVSYVNPVKGRGVTGEFWETIEQMKEGLESLREDPSPLVGLMGESGGEPAWG